MAKKPVKQPPVAAGEAFAIPLGNGQYAVCRVLRAREESNLAFVVAAGWVGGSVPGVDDPALRSVLRLTHHSWKGRACAVWVGGPPPEEFVRIGHIPPGPEDRLVKSPELGGWPFFKIQPLEQWKWDHPEDKPAEEASPEGRFILHRFNGDEEYRFKSAVMFAYPTEKGATLWFEVEADPAGATRCEDTAEMGMSPNAEVGIDLRELDADQLVGRKFSIPGTKTDDEDSCMSLLYYCEHEPLRKNRITVVSRTGDRFRLRWTAVTQDMNFYNDSKPPTKVEIEGDFLFKDIGRWTKNKRAAKPKRDGG